jgi:hypothetical protein
MLRSTAPPGTGCPRAIGVLAHREATTATTITSTTTITTGAATITITGIDFAPLGRTAHVFDEPHLSARLAVLIADALRTLGRDYVVPPFAMV